MEFLRQFFSQDCFGSFVLIKNVLTVREFVCCYNFSSCFCYSCCWRSFFFLLVVLVTIFFFYYFFVIAIDFALFFVFIAFLLVFLVLFFFFVFFCSLFYVVIVLIFVIVIICVNVSGLHDVFFELERDVFILFILELEIKVHWIAF